MEFFRIIDTRVSEEVIAETITLNAIETMSTQMVDLGILNDREASVGGALGEFTLSRDVIKGGIRFTLVECPNAFTWSITTGYPPAVNSVVIHATINRIKKRESFVEMLDDFLDDHAECLLEILKAQETSKKSTPSA